MSMQCVTSAAKLIVLATATAACGGGSGGSEDADYNAGASQIDPVDSVASSSASSSALIENTVLPGNNDSDVAAVSTVDIVVDENFSLASTSHLDIHVSVPELEYQRSYLHVCHANTEGELDYNDCLVSSPLKNGRFDTQLVLGNDVTSLHMEIWRYDIHSEPLSYQWNSASGRTWNVN